MVLQRHLGKAQTPGFVRGKNYYRSKLCVWGPSAPDRQYAFGPNHPFLRTPKSMEMTFRWFGDDDPISLAYIRQIPGVRGIVSALYDVPVGDTWPRESLDRLTGRIADAGLKLQVVESIPVH